MKAKYCLPIIKNTKKEVLKALKIRGFDYYEVWVDYIKDLDDKFIVDIVKTYQSNLLILFRRQNLEKIKLSLERRQEIISLLSKSNVFLDLDFLTQHEELEFLRTKDINIKLILSYHNYKETPSLDHTETLINKMKRYYPNIYKIATFCKTKEDALVLLKLLLKLKAQNLKYIISGMGENGLITRIFGSIWGNEMSFAPLNLKEKSAQGQLNKKQLELILKELSINGR